MSALTVRAYNVLFGDALLVSIPDRDPQSGIETSRHILIDVGNVLQGAGGADQVFSPIVQDIRSRLGSRPVDLYVMTHEHLDHVQGLPFAANLGLELDVEYTWLTASCEPGYYDRYPEARRKRTLYTEAYLALERRLMADPAASTPWMAALMLNNSPWQTGPCVEYLSQLGKVANSFVHRQTELRPGVNHPFLEARLEILAPESDTADYYGPIRSFPVPSTGEAQPPPLSPPPGVDPDAFQRLVESWKRGAASSVLAIDRAANNTSIVFTVEWRGWRLLFSGDAELKSWQLMASQGLLASVHFLKVGHHGSHNATPPDSILEQILPAHNQSGKPRTALISTCDGTYNGVPHEPTLARLAARCDTLLTTQSVPPGEAVEISFHG